MTTTRPSLPFHLTDVAAGLSPHAAELYAALETLAVKIVVEHPQPDVVAFDRVLDAALTAHAMCHYVKCDIGAALDAYDLPREAAPIAALLVGLTMPNAEAVRCIARSTVWHANFEGRADAANSNGPGH